MGVGTMKMVAATKVEVGGGSHHRGVGGRDGCWHHDASHLGLPEYQSARVPESQRAHSLPATCCSPDKNSASCITSNVCDECRHF